MTSRKMFSVFALGAFVLALASLAETRPAAASGFVIDPRCPHAQNPVVCTCYLQNGGWIGYRWGRRLVFGPPNHMMIDVINNCMMSAKSGG